jgi:hypothetical protein
VNGLVAGSEGLDQTFGSDGIHDDPQSNV